MRSVKLQLDLKPLVAMIQLCGKAKDPSHDSPEGEHSRISPGIGKSATYEKTV
jgi:hypothetical protein